MDLFKFKRNYRDEISAKLTELSKLYDKIDRCFHENYKLISLGITISDSIYQTKSSSSLEIYKWLREFKIALSDILIMRSRHKPSWNDGEYEINLDCTNEKSLELLNKKFDQIYNIINQAKIITIN